jgi:hypothetical protein
MTFLLKAALLWILASLVLGALLSKLWPKRGRDIPRGMRPIQPLDWRR